MAIDFTKASLSTKAAAATTERVKAQLWANIGYTVEVETTEGKEQRFVNLPFGLPIDTMEMVPTNSSNEVFAALQSAKNDLLKQVIAAGMQMKPGEEKILNLQIQLRRVSEPCAVVNNPDSNPFIKKLAL